MTYKPLKKFGQNYLTDKNTILKIIENFEPKSNDSIIEIGPGRGALTTELVKHSSQITAIEIDSRVIDTLRNQLPNVKFFNRDFLKWNFDELSFNKKSRVIGNIPYNITSPIIFKLIENRNLFSDALLMVQYEVARRIVSEPKSKEYGILAVILRYFSSVELRFKISPNVFTPKPKVDSAIVTIKFDKKCDEIFDDRFFINVVKAAFGNRRKTLKNSLNNSIFVSYDFNEIDLDFSRRAETLTLEEFIFLATNLYRQK